MITFLSLDQPNTPSKPTAKNIGPREVQITWPKPKTNVGAPVIQYIIEMMENGNGKWQTLKEKVCYMYYFQSECILDR